MWVAGSLKKRRWKVAKPAKMGVAGLVMSRVTPGYSKPYPYPHPSKPLLLTSGKGFLRVSIFIPLPLPLIPLTKTPGFFSIITVHNTISVQWYVNLPWNCNKKYISVSSHRVLHYLDQTFSKKIVYYFLTTGLLKPLYPWWGVGVLEGLNIHTLTLTPHTLDWNPCSSLDRTHLCQNWGQMAPGLLEKGLEQSYFLNEYNGTYLCKEHLPVAQFIRKLAHPWNCLKHPLSHLSHLNLSEVTEVLKFTFWIQESSVFFRFQVKFK